jgi:hypothetical protein
MVLHWVATALLKAERSFTTVATAAELQQLARALECHADEVRMRAQAALVEPQKAA